MTLKVLEKGLQRENMTERVHIHRHKKVNDWYLKPGSMNTFIFLPFFHFDEMNKHFLMVMKGQ